MSSRIDKSRFEGKIDRGCVRFRLSFFELLSFTLRFFLSPRGTSVPGTPWVETRSWNAYSSCWIFRRSRSKQERESLQSASLQISSSSRADGCCCFYSRSFLPDGFINKDIARKSLNFELDFLQWEWNGPLLLKGRRKYFSMNQDDSINPKLIFNKILR